MGIHHLIHGKLHSLLGAVCMVGLGTGIVPLEYPSGKYSPTTPNYEPRSTSMTEAEF